MPRVSVEQEAFHDPRLAAAARRTPLRRAEVLGWRLLSVWSLVTQTQRTRQRRCVIAEALGLRDAAHLEALVDVGLAEEVEGEERDIELAPMGELFGAFEWLGDLRATAPSGGRARAAMASRDPDTGKMLARDYRAEIVEALAEHGPVNSRALLAKMLRADRGRLGAVLDALLEAGEVIETRDGFALPSSDLPSGHTTAQTTGATRPDGNGQPSSALVPVLAPVPVPKAFMHVPRDTPDGSATRPDDNSHTTAQTTGPGDTPQQAILDGFDEENRTAVVTVERAHDEQLARRVIGWLNELHRQHGRLQGHRGFDPLAKDVLQSAKRWRKAKLAPEEVIAVCEHRIDQWRAVSSDWLNNCTPQVLFRPNKFDAALQEVRAGHTHATEPGKRARERDIRFGAVEPSPDTVYAGGEVQL